MTESEEAASKLFAYLRENLHTPRLVNIDDGDILIEDQDGATIFHVHVEYW